MWRLFKAAKVPNYDLICRVLKGASLKEMCCQEEIWESTKGNATYVKVIKQARNKEVFTPAHNFLELRSNISTFCALLFFLFGKGCDLYRSMSDILNILSHLFSCQKELA